MVVSHIFIRMCNKGFDLKIIEGILSTTARAPEEGAMVLSCHLESSDGQCDLAQMHVLGDLRQESNVQIKRAVGVSRSRKPFAVENEIKKTSPKDTSRGVAIRMPSGSCASLVASCWHGMHTLFIG